MTMQNTNKMESTKQIPNQDLILQRHMSRSFSSSMKHDLRWEVIIHFVVIVELLTITV
jgi:hypothetical protein